MKNKICVISLMFGLLLSSCNSKKNKNVSDSINQEEEDKIVYTQADDITSQINSIFTEGFKFSEDIGINEIAYLKTGDNTYKIVYFLDDESDFNKIQSLNIAFRIYPKDPSMLQVDADKKALAKTLATKCEIQEMGGSLVIISEEFTINPKSFTKIKVYIYHPEDGVYGKMMTLLNIELS